jgi:hypothetical protein
MESRCARSSFAASTSRSSFCRNAVVADSAGPAAVSRSAGFPDTGTGSRGGARGGYRGGWGGGRRRRRGCGRRSRRGRAQRRGRRTGTRWTAPSSLPCVCGGEEMGSPETGSDLGERGISVCFVQNYFGEGARAKKKRCFWHLGPGPGLSRKKSVPALEQIWTEADRTWA